MTMPCSVSDALSRTLPWEGREWECQDCRATFMEWRDHPAGDLVIDLCEDCHAVQHNNDRPEDMFDD